MKCGPWLIPVLFLAAAAAQELPPASAFALHRLTFAAEPAPDFPVSYWRPEAFHVEHGAATIQWEAAPPAAAADKPLNIPMLQTLRRNRLVAVIAGSIPSIARAFDDDRATKRRVDIGPLIDIDDGRLGIRMKIRLSQ